MHRHRIWAGASWERRREMPPELVVPGEETCCDQGGMCSVCLWEQRATSYQVGEARTVSMAQMGPKKKPWHKIKCTQSFFLGCQLLISLHPIRDV